MVRVVTDEEFCRDILPRVSRTFALSIEALPEPLRRAIRVSYLLCRVVDTIEDDPTLHPEDRQRLFAEFRRLMQDNDADASLLELAFEGGEPSDDRNLCRKAGAAFRVFRSLPEELGDAARPHISEMAEGMAEYALRWRGQDRLTVLRDRKDLERYCYFVAGTVGNLLTALFIATEEGLSSETKRDLVDRSVSFGLGLQMTNIVKDVTDDRARGWCFLPAELCDRHGISPEDLLDPALRDRAVLVVHDVIAMAQRRLDEALEYTLLLPSSARDVRLFVLVPLVLALSTLSLVRQSPQVLDPTTDVKISRSTVAHALTRAHQIVGDNDAIRELCRQAAALEI